MFTVLKFIMLYIGVTCTYRLATLSSGTLFYIFFHEILDLAGSKTFTIWTVSCRDKQKKILLPKQNENMQFCMEISVIPEQRIWPLQKNYMFGSIKF